MQNSRHRVAQSPVPEVHMRVWEKTQKEPTSGTRLESSGEDDVASRTESHSQSDATGVHIHRASSLLT